MIGDKILANIDIVKMGENKTRITIDMPIWTRKGNDGKIYISLALLGGINTFATSEEGVEVAVQEATRCFFLSAAKFGKGVKKELAELGWQLKKNKIRYRVSAKSRSPEPPASYGVDTNLPIWREAMKTGKSKSVTVDI